MSLADVLRALEERLMDPSVRGNAAELKQLLAPNFVEFGSSGRIFSRDGIIAVLARERAFTPPAVSDFTVRAYTADWAILTYITIRPAVPPAPASQTLRSSTWVRRDDLWQMIFHQGTTIPPAKLS